MCNCCPRQAPEAPSSSQPGWRPWHTHWCLGDLGFSPLHLGDTESSHRECDECSQPSASGWSQEPGACLDAQLSLASVSTSMEGAVRSDHCRGPCRSRSVGSEFCASPMGFPELHSCRWLRDDGRLSLTPQVQDDAGPQQAGLWELVGCSCLGFQGHSLALGQTLREVECTCSPPPHTRDPFISIEAL